MSLDSAGGPFMVAHAYCLFRNKVNTKELHDIVETIFIKDIPPPQMIELTVSKRVLLAEFLLVMLLKNNQKDFKIASL